ncbi:MAG: cytochrome c biogenesis protein [Chloroflexota bacterium]|nr:cytochrome c biogenesis protein [Chloroflexota bacterium]
MGKSYLRNILSAVSFLLMAASLYMVFVYVPTEATMGIVQRIFYLMVPVAWLSLLSFLIVFIGSILYLRKKQSRWDVLARSSAEIGIIFTTLTLITGSLWARPVWGVWWTWEPRLTATLVLWFIYLAYFLARSLAAEEHRGATFAAVVGILGFVDVPIIGLATTLWRGIHPGALIFQGGLAPSMLLTLMVSLAAFTALYSLLLLQRISMKNDEIEIKRLLGLTAERHNTGDR